MRSGRLYSLITKHWLKVAPVLVVTFGVLEYVVGGLTSDSRLEYYVFAWASVTSGLWFLFDRVEQALRIRRDVRRPHGSTRPTWR